MSSFIESSLSVEEEKQKKDEFVQLNRICEKWKIFDKVRESLLQSVHARLLACKTSDDSFKIALEAQIINRVIESIKTQLNDN